MQSIQGWEASAHHQGEPCQGRVLPWDEPGRSWSSSRSLRDGAEPPAGPGISTGSRDGFRSAPSPRHLPHGEGSGAVPAPRAAQKQGISVNVARHLPGSTTPGSRAARLSEPSIKHKKTRSNPANRFFQSTKIPAGSLSQAGAHSGSSTGSSLPVLLSQNGPGAPSRLLGVCRHSPGSEFFFLHIPEPTFSSP